MDKNFPLDQGLPWTFTDKPVTAWGGLRLVQEMLTRMRLREALVASGLPQPRSNRGYDPVVMIEAFITCVWIGGVRFSHTAVVRFDRALCEIFGWRSVASVSTFTRFFRRFKREDVDRVFGSLSRWFWGQLSPRTLTLDLDSTPITRFGAQEGAAAGYNPRRQGSPCQKPLFAFAATMRMVLHAWLRPGNTTDNNGVCQFFAEALSLLGEQHCVGLVRADAGFYDGKFLNLLEERQLNYIVGCKIMQPLRHQIGEQKCWSTIDDGIAATEFRYQGIYWQASRRIVVIRQKIERRPDAQGKLLIDVPGYTIQALVTSLELAPEEVWRLYNGRSDSENRIAELKNDFGMNGFSLDPFYATEAAFRAVLLAYNLMSLFRQALLQSPKAVRLSTMRFECFALGAWVGRSGRKRMLRISLPSERRTWFTGLFQRIEGFSPPWPQPA